MRQVAVVIGRFQPFHNGHKEMIKKALERSDLAIVVIGSASCAPDIKNPWSVHDRVAMLSNIVGEVPNSCQLRWVSVLDHPYDNNQWLKELKIKVKKLLEEGDVVTLIGHDKDESTHYLKWFKDWLFLDVGKHEGSINATTIRKSIFEESMIPQQLPEGVKKYLSNNWMGSKEHQRLIKEYVYAMKENARMEKERVILTCADAVVTRPGQVLVVRRKNNNLGHGLMSLPGVIVKTDEKVIHASIRASYDKAGVIVKEEWMKGYKLFDDPKRSVAGRRISHAFRFDIPENWELKDGGKAEWIDIADISLYSEEFFEDHVAIIEEMIK